MPSTLFCLVVVVIFVPAVVDLKECQEFGVVCAQIGTALSGNHKKTNGGINTFQIIFI